MERLPIDPFLPRIASSVGAKTNVILTATPGAGKTTRLPPELFDRVNGQILVLQPRRMAAIAACSRVCEERGWRMGEEAGYQVRFDSRFRSDTRLIFLTDALLVRRMIDDSEMKGVGLVVIDEFHERNLNQDLVLGALRELQLMGRDLKMLIMSATLDIQRLHAFLPDADVFDIPGAVFPLEIRHARQTLRPQTDREFYDCVTEATMTGIRSSSGDVLVFLPGASEIARLQERLATATDRAIVPLHGSLSLQDQRQVLRPSKQPRVILSTNVAEASVTVPGVDWVVDTGLAKIMEMNPRTGFSSLELKRISQFNARQRAGRAARQKAGVCERLWTTHEDSTLAKEPIPECQRVDLSSAILWLAHLGVTDFAGFSWFEPPSEILLAWALRSLRSLGALDSGQRLTDLGRRLLRFPLSPRWGALLTMGDAMGIGETAARLAAILNERDFAEGLETHSQSECDLLLRLDLLAEAERRRSARPALQTVLDSSRQLKTLVGKGEGDATDVRRLLLVSQRDRLCRRRGQSDRALMVGGRGVRLSNRSQVRRSDFFVALQGVDLPGQPDTTIGLACGLEKSFVLTTLADSVQTVEEIVLDENKGQFYSSRVRSIGDLPLEEPTLGPVAATQIEGRMAEALVSRWDWIVEQNVALKAWMQRWRFFVHYEPRYHEQWNPDRIRQVLEMAAFGQVSIESVLRQDFVGLIGNLMNKETLHALDKEVPSRFAAPSGVSHPILYAELHGAFVEIRLQEIFGLIATPRIVFGKVPLTFRLLGPNFRPVQITSDLENFWRNGYHEVRKELRARYPKHSWPEDPSTAAPVAKGRRRS